MACEDAIKHTKDILGIIQVQHEAISDEISASIISDVERNLTVKAAQNNDLILNKGDAKKIIIDALNKHGFNNTQEIINTVFEVVQNNTNNSNNVQNTNTNVVTQNDEELAHQLLFEECNNYDNTQGNSNHVSNNNNSTTQDLDEELALQLQFGDETENYNFQEDSNNNNNNTNASTSSKSNEE